MDIDIGYNNVPLYKNIKLYIPDHGIISILGQNGCGKSTFYKTLLGIIPPVRGSIENNILNDIAIVSDYVHIPEEVKVKDVFILLGEEKVANTKEKYLDFYKYIESFENQYVRTLSSGQKRMVEIYSILLSGKTILILDEAANTLDYDNKNLLLSQIKKLSEKILFFHTSHELDDALNLGGDIYGLFKENRKMIKFEDGYNHENLKKFLGYRWMEV